MRLEERLPDGVTVDGRFYRLDFDFRNVLRMMAELDRDDIMPEARTYNALRCLTKHPPKRKQARILAAVRKTLFPDKPGRESEKVTDFVQDAGLIRTAFRQVYGIDLFRDKLHWLEFSELLNNVPDGTRYTDVINIRVRPLPAPTKYNQKEREALMKAKADLALQLTPEEQERRYAHDVQNVFKGLEGLMNRWGVTECQTGR